jgi:putative tributyrin esterase
MALIDVNFYSNTLMRNVTYKAIIPVDGPNHPESITNEKKLLKTIYLLHGLMGNYTDWVTGTRVAQWANEHHIAVIMPSGDNSFYVDHESVNNYYGEFIGRELVEETRKLFPFSLKREDTFIVGLSMGGYGAIRNGLKYNDTFAAIAALSSALIIDQAINSKEDAEWVFRKRSFYEAIFGDLSKLKGSDKDPEALIQKIKQIKSQMPRIYLACGTEDLLIENNRKFHDALTRENVKHTYLESKGAHDWMFWDEYIKKVIIWLLNG